MMNYLGLRSEHEDVRRRIREFVEKNVLPVAEELDKAGEHPAEVWAKMKDEGLFGILFPKEYGGEGLDYLSYIIVVEELSKACAAIGVSYEIHMSLVAQTILKFGNEEQKKKFLVPLAKGETIGAFALTEPSAGTDAGSLETTAVLKGDNYLLNGRKYFIMNAPVSGIFIVMAMTDRAQGSKGMSAFLVEKDTQGLKFGKLFDKMGIRASLTSEVIFEDCHIPKENLLGSEGDGFKIALTALDSGRIGIAAQAVGIAQAALDASVAYSQSRTQFKRPISNFQAIQWMLADMETSLSAARLLVYNAATMVDRGARFSREAAMAKLFASDAAVAITRNAMQIHGGYGYMKDKPIERYYRDAKITEIYEGTSEVQRMVISSSLLKG
jgi:butyryl-CoA dehydrogenase